MTVSHLRFKSLSLVAFVALCAVVFGYLLTIAGVRLPFSSSPYVVKAVVPDPFNVVANSDVRLTGVKIGSVASVSPHGDNGLITMDIEQRYAPLYRDATVQVRTKTLVGENYVAIDPGSPQAGRLPSGATLTVQHALEAVQLDKILSAMDSRTRQQVRANLDELGGALAGRGQDLNALFGVLRPAVAQGQQVLGIIETQRQQFADIVQHAGELMQTFQQRTHAVRVLASAADTAARAAASRDDALAQTLRELPSTLGQARRTAAQLGAFSTVAAPVIEDLATSTRSLAPVVRDLGPAASDATDLFNALTPFVARADPLLGSLSTFSNDTRGAVPALRGLLDQLDPVLTYLAPYDREFGGFFGAVGATTNIKDGVGNFLRVQQYYSPTSFSGLTPSLEAALRALIGSGLLSKLTTEGQNPYPKPGTVGAPAPPTSTLTPTPPAPLRGRRR